MCPSSDSARCKCGTTWKPEDANAPGRCPACGERAAVIENCAKCPLHDLRHFRQNSPAGRLLDRALELEFDCSKFSVPWSDITAEERDGLRILIEERSAYQREQDEARQNGLPN